MYKIFTLTVLFSTTLLADFYISQGKKCSLSKLTAFAPLKKNRSALSPVSYYKNASGKRLGVDKNLIVDFQDLSIQLYIEKEYGLSLIKKLNAHMFVYQIKDKDLTLETANALSHLEGIKFAHPDFIVQKKNRTNDPLYDQAWHLSNGRGINVEQAWRYTKGAGIIVGIYDEGIDIEHEDLRDNILGYGNFNKADGQIDIVRSASDLNNDLSNAPAPASDIWHGTACAGLIAASGDNFRGSVGVAPESKLLALRYASSNISRDIEAFYAMANNGAAIISNSWGTYAMQDSFNAALKDLSENGRNGKGTLIFFAAGNDGCNMDGYYSSNANGQIECKTSSAFDPINDESESPYVLSIAATTQYDNIADYSNYGSNIDFAAPGSQYPASIVTTDASGTLGANNSNYTSSFSGTSAAAPIAAGTAALVLAENSTLSKEEVVEILKVTADKEGRYAYDSEGRNDHWGYGRVNAGRAVALAATYGKSQIENFAHIMYQNMH